jgi:hypothetical protein
MANRFYREGLEATLCGEGLPADPTLKEGASGPAVAKLQLRLNAAGASVGDAGADGNFGPATKQAVENFQNAYGLEADGVVGPATWAKLYEVTGAPSSAPVGSKPVLRMDPLEVKGRVPESKKKDWEWAALALGGVLLAGAAWLGSRDS